MTPEGQYELLVMPMGQCNSVATFQRMMSHVFPFADYGSYVICYLDDILVFNESEEEHLQHSEQVLKRLEEQQLFIKRS